MVKDFFNKNWVRTVAIVLSCILVLGAFSFGLSRIFYKPSSDKPDETETEETDTATHFYISLTPSSIGDVSYYSNYADSIYNYVSEEFPNSEIELPFMPDLLTVSIAYSYAFATDGSGGGVLIDWGDGNIDNSSVTSEASSETIAYHTYEDYGDYDISLDVVDYGSISLGWGSKIGRSVLYNTFGGIFNFLTGFVCGEAVTLIRPYLKANSSTQNKPSNKRNTLANKRNSTVIKKTAIKPPLSDKRLEKEDFPHFRRYKKSDHPVLVVGELLGEKEKEEYKYRKVMHGDRDGRHLNEVVFPNPDKTDVRPMYIARRVRHDEKIFFGKRLSWKYPNTNDKKKK
jgi:hypothetical protein